MRAGYVRKDQSSSSVDQERDQLKAEAQQFYEAAKAKAEAGEVTEAGLLILKGLNCERRAKPEGLSVRPHSQTRLKLEIQQAGDRTRTGDVQLGKLTFYH